MTTLCSQQSLMTRYLTSLERLKQFQQQKVKPSNLRYRLVLNAVKFLRNIIENNK